MQLGFFVLCSIFGLVAKAEDRALVLTGFEAPPYLYLDASGVPTGLLVDIVRGASEESGVPVKFLVTSWPRAQLETERGRADLIFPVVYTKEREAWLEYPIDPITQFEMMIFAHKDAPFSFSGDASDLHGMTIGKIANGRMHPNFRALEESGKATVEGRESIEELLRGSQLRRLDAFVAPYLLTIWTANNLGISAVKEFQDPIGVSDIFLALSKKSANADLWERFQPHLPSLRSAERKFIAELR
ncbi:transporter substrate-binding domain-containing protein [Roseibium denhamense]